MAISGSDEPVRVNMETVLVRLLFPFLKSIPAKPTWMVSINAVEAGGSRSGLSPSPPSPRATAAMGAAGTALKTCGELAALAQPHSGCPPHPGLSFLVSSSGSLISLSALFTPATHGQVAAHLCAPVSLGAQQRPSRTWAAASGSSLYS